MKILAMGLLFAGMLLSGTLAAASALSNDPSTSARIGPPVIGVKIASERANYTIGQAVRLSALIVNNGNVPYMVTILAPWRSIALHIVDANGRIVTPGSVSNDDFRMPLSYVLLPNATRILLAPHDPGVWVDLAKFGYRLGAGHYTITAIPRLYVRVVDISSLTSDDKRFTGEFLTPEQTTSNVVTISIAGIGSTLRAFHPAITAGTQDGQSC